MCGCALDESGSESVLCVCVCVSTFLVPALKVSAKREVCFSSLNEKSAGEGYNDPAHGSNKADSF